MTETLDIRQAAAEAAAMLARDEAGAPTPTSVAFARLGAALGICRPCDKRATVAAAWQALAEGRRAKLSELPGDKQPRGDRLRCADGAPVVTADEILAVVNDGVDSLADIAEILGASRNRVGRTLSSLAARGAVKRVGMGRYRPAQREQAR